MNINTNELTHYMLVGYFIFNTLIIDENLHLIIIILLINLVCYMILSNIYYSLYYFASMKICQHKCEHIFITLSKAYYCHLRILARIRCIQYISNNTMYNQMYTTEITTVHRTMITLTLTMRT